MGPAYGLDELFDGIIDEFMRTRDRFARYNTIGGDVFDGFMSATVIDRGIDFFLAEMRLPQAHVGAAKLVASHLTKLIYALETKRWEHGGHTDGHDVIDAVKDRMISHVSSEMMKDAARSHHLFNVWELGEAREATRRFVRHLFEQHGRAHFVDPP